ncbi:hypothetical protein B0H19DRAFT_1299486, partial [Mycena capillaripes]
EIIRWLSPINFFLRHTDISQARQPETGGWLLMNPKFQEWRSCSGSTLWCRGHSGVGKTVLASLVVDHLGEKFKNKNIGVACIYLNHKEADDQTSAKLLSSLWRQLILDRDVSSLAEELYEKQDTPTPDQVFALLLSVIEKFSKVYIVVDALDECQENQRQELLEHLIKMGPTVNLLITSRHNITLDSTLPNTSTLEIRATKEDIWKYLDAQITASMRLMIHVQRQPDLREEILSKITSTVAGTFLLAKLHVESLSKKINVTGIREALKGLPQTINISYDDAMKEIDEQDEEEKQLAYSTLTWVANAKRPLTTSELQTALAIKPNTKSLNIEDIVPMDIILPVCAGLVIVDEQLSVVRLVHYTTQEYLDSIQAQRFPNAQTEITYSLLTYL